MSFLGMLGFHGNKNEALDVKEEKAKAEPLLDTQVDSIETARSNAGVEKAEMAPRAQRGDTMKMILERMKAASLTPEEMLTNIKNNFGIDSEEFLKYATGHEQIQAEKIKEFDDRMQAALINQLQKTESNPEVGDALKTKAGHLALLALMTFLSFFPKAAAQDVTKDNNILAATAGRSFEKKTPDASKTASFVEAKSSLDTKAAETKAMENLAKLDLTKSFETDKADISKENEKEIKDQVNEFLNKITPANYKDFMSREGVIYVSSDQRLTSKYPGGNFELSGKRGTTTEKINKEAFVEHDFSNSGLSEKQIKELKNRDFSVQIFESKNGPEKGVTYLTDLNNSETGKNYTETEIKTLQESKRPEDKKKYDSLLESCRYVKVNLMAVGDKVETVTQTPLSFPNLPKFQENKETWLFLDNTPSNRDNIQRMAKHVLELSGSGDENKIFHIGTFANSVGNIQTAKGMKEASEIIKGIKIISEDKEQIMKCSLDVLEKKITAAENTGEERTLMYASDEAFHDVSGEYLTKLGKQCKAKNIKLVYLFSYFDQNTKQMEDSQISLEDLTKAFYKAGGPLEKQKEALEKGANDKTNDKFIRETLLERSKNIEKEKLNVSEFEVGGKLIKLPTV